MIYFKMLKQAYNLFLHFLPPSLGLSDVTVKAAGPRRYIIYIYTYEDMKTLIHLKENTAFTSYIRDNHSATRLVRIESFICDMY